MRDVLNRVLLLVVLTAMVLVAPTARAEALKQTFEHQLLVNSEPQSWEHRIDLPEAAMQKGWVFTKRNLGLLGRLVIEREEFKATYYYVKVRLPKHVSEAAKGILTVDLEFGPALPVSPEVKAPTDLALFAGGAALRPIMTWKGEARFAAVTLYDVDENQTVMERVAVNVKFAEVKEGWLKLHHYRWAVKLSDETGHASREVQAGFRIEKKDGVVVTIPE